MTKEQAVATASERLAAIEMWARYTCYAMVVCAACLAILTTIAAKGAMDYVAARSAFAKMADRPRASIGDPSPRLGQATEGRPGR